MLALLFPIFVDEEGNIDLFEEVGMKELKETLHNFQKDKSPGLDGLIMEFYLGFFELLGLKLLQAIGESRRNGRLYAPINATFIALIPKSDERQSFDDFRPISLCNCVYKILAKVIARRQKPILSGAISQEQFVFLEGVISMKQSM
jgi:hypothetical protein